jgi:ornithine cyclodeaminase/alanine dehydrogenase-like protein (mu-crystallin family)
MSDTLQVDAQAVETYREALQGAGIACATTHSAEPVIRRSWLTSGVHVTSVGYGPLCQTPVRHEVEVILCGQQGETGSTR